MGVVVRQIADAMIRNRSQIRHVLTDPGPAAIIPHQLAQRALTPIATRAATLAQAAPCNSIPNRDQDRVPNRIHTGMAVVAIIDRASPWARKIAPPTISDA
jgi:hypothetical protein